MSHDREHTVEEWIALIMEFGQAEQEQLASDEDVLSISKRLIAKNRQAYEELAK